MGEGDTMKWRGIRPTDPEEEIPVKQGTAANLKVQAAIAAAQTIAVTSAAHINVKATVIGDDTAPIKVKQNTASNLKVEAAIAAAQTVGVTQATAANLKSEVVPAAAAIFQVTPVLPIGATIIALRDYASNATDVMRTVTAGKTLHLIGWSLSCAFVGSTADSGYLYVTTAGDAILFIIQLMEYTGTHTITDSTSYPIPMPIEAGWKIKLTSDDATVKADAFIYGYEI